MKNTIRKLSVIVCLIVMSTVLVMPACADSLVFNQMDTNYQSVPYMGASVSQRGCGICAAASILDMLYDTDEYTPEGLARTYGNPYNKVEGIVYDSCATVAQSVLEYHGVTVREATSKEDLWVSLANGACALGLMSAGLTNTPSGHFIALLGLKVDEQGYGRIIVADSNSGNWGNYGDCWTEGFYLDWLWSWKGGFWICELATK